MWVLSISTFKHTCQHLEIRNQDTFIIADLPPSPPLPRCRPNILATATEKGRSKQINHALHSTPKSKSHSYIIRMVWIDKGNLSICRKKTWKNTDLCFTYYSVIKNRNIYKLNTCQLLEIRNQDTFIIAIPPPLIIII